jgi:hypothetical protein
MEKEGLPTPAAGEGATIGLVLCSKLLLIFYFSLTILDF